MPRTNKIIIRSGTAAPTASDFVTGEPAWDKTNGKFYVKNTAGTMVEIGAGGATEIYEYATTASFPAPGSAARIYIATDTSRAYRYDTTNSVYVELGAISAYDSRFDLLLPPAPTSVTASAGNAQATVSWSAPTVLSQTPITDYIVQYSTNSGSTWTTFSDGTATATSATVTGLSNGTAVTFRVAAVNGIGTGSYSTSSSAVTPVAGDPNFSSVALLMHMEGSGATFTDSSSVGRSITASGGSTQSTAQSRFGSKSWLSDGSGDHLTFGGGSTLTMGTGDFTIEMWLRLNSYAQASLWESTPIGGSGSRSTGFIWYIVSGGTVYMYHSGSNILSTSSAIIPLSQWSHVALSRASGTTRMYVDGSQVASTSSSYNDTAAGGAIGAFCDGGSYSIDGYIDEVRVTRGVARYSDSTLTVPTAAFPDN
jgi:hypothetical protein